MENQENIEKQLYQFQYVKQQRDMFQNQLDIVNASLGNLINTKRTLENIKDGVKVNDEILVPIGGIVNIKANIKETEKLLLYVSQDVVIEKSFEGSIEYIDKMIEKHDEQIQFLRKQIQNLDINLQGMSRSIQQAMPQRQNL